ncbi:hypothetical protein JAAARDRAFT_38694 [Jaapia argillacea MUCL 33604]|uniref:Major facilitator superfamily (MFS) profile domain-containing protein n=1 Tax=Jaapia argillacea MUCL 33604 TaxID=933084 RepID=A0A067PGN6_9AGAM|nr:hypothetical protein JAAARDRAFT_38694 [Jaapia argillacea MUCL 33604]
MPPSFDNNRSTTNVSAVLSSTVVGSTQSFEILEKTDHLAECENGGYDVQVETTPHSAVNDPPDGGWRAWLTIAGAWMIQFSTFGHVSAFGVYQAFYTRDFLSYKSASEISWIGSVQLFLLYAPGVLVGRAFDAGYFHHTNAIGSVIYVFSMFMHSLVKPHQYYQVFLAQGLGVGLGQGILFLPSLSIVSHHFKNRRALATGIVVTGASVGGIVFPIMLNRLFAHGDGGFVLGVQVSAACVTGLLVVANLIMRVGKGRGRSAGGRGMGAKGGGPAGSNGLPVDLKGIIRDWAYVSSICGAFLTNIGLFFPFFYMQLFAEQHGVNENLSFYSLAILNGGSILGRLVPPFLADRVGVYNMILPCMLISSTMVFAIFGAGSVGGLIGVGGVFGFFSGAYVSLIPSLLVMMSRHMGELGVRMGIAFTIVGLAMLIGTPIEGALLGTNTEYSWWRGITFSGVCISMGCCMMLLSRILFVRSRGKGWFV